jgi:hypothetical protein
MKKLLTILLLLPAFCFSQITITELGGGFQTSGVGSTNGIIFVAGRLYIVVAGITNAGGTPATMSITGTGQTWTQIINATGVTVASDNYRIQAFRYAATTNHTNNVVYNYTGTQDGSFAAVLEVTGVDVTGTNGSNAIVQTVSNAADATANPSLTLAAIANGSNAVIAAFMRNSNPFNGTPESGWTEELDGGYNSPTTGGYILHRLTTTDNTPTVTASSGNWVGIAMELKSSQLSTGFPLYFYTKK